MKREERANHLCCFSLQRPIYLYIWVKKMVLSYTYFGKHEKSGMVSKISLQFFFFLFSLYLLSTCGNNAFVIWSRTCLLPPPLPFHLFSTLFLLNSFLLSCVLTACSNHILRFIIFLGYKSCVFHQRGFFLSKSVEKVIFLFTCCCQMVRWYGVGGLIY